MAPPEVDDEQCELVGIAGVAPTALETAPGGAVLHAAGPLIVAWTPGSDRRSCLRGHARAVAALALMHDGERLVSAERDERGRLRLLVFDSTDPEPAAWALLGASDDDGDADDAAAAAAADELSLIHI